MSIPILSRRATKPLVTPIGMDLSPRRLRIAQLAQSGPCWKVIRLNHWNRREGEIGTIGWDGFAIRIRQALQQMEYQQKRVIAGLSLPELENHALEIRNRKALESPEMFSQAVRREMQRVMKVAEDGKRIGYWRLPASGAARTTAIGVAAEKAQVDGISKLARALGLVCDRIDASACALSRLGAVLRQRPDADPKEVWAVLDIGQRLLRLVVCIDQTPVLIRALGEGGQAWTESVAESLSVSEQTAEIHKLDYGIGGALNVTCRPPAADTSTEARTELGSMIYNILSPDLDRAVSEIERSYEYIMRCYPDSRAGELFLVGGGSGMKGLDRYLAEKLGVPVRGLDELVGRTVGSDAGDSESPPLCVSASIREPLGPYACAIGLAIE